MNSPHPNRGPWIHRLTVTVLTSLVALLFYWLPGFVLSDIGSMRGPQWMEVEEARVDAGLLERGALRVPGLRHFLFRRMPRLSWCARKPAPGLQPLRCGHHQREPAKLNTCIDILPLTR